MKAGDRPLPEAVFVYGTLQPGEARWPLLQSFAAGEPRAAGVAGHLYDTGRGYPAAVFGDDADQVIPGALVPLDAANLERALGVLDQLEGTDFGLYERVVVTTTDGDPAWAYSWQGDCESLTLIDTWRAS